jgi:hypothetical protein
MNRRIAKLSSAVLGSPRQSSPVRGEASESDEAAATLRALRVVRPLEEESYLIRTKGTRHWRQAAVYMQHAACSG